MARRRLLTLMAAVLFPLVAAGPYPARAAAVSDTAAIVTIVHALPNFTADVYVNGKLTLNGFEPETATDPLQLAPGDYHVDIRDVGAPADSTPVLQGDLTLKAGQNLSIIAGLTLEGEPTLNVFANDVSPVRAGKARLVVRHVANAPPVDAMLDGKVKVQDVANGGEEETLVPPGKGTLQINASGDSSALVDPMDVGFREGTATIVYVIGSQPQSTLGLMAQSINDIESTVGSVLTGDGGLAARPGLPLWAIGFIVLAAVSAAGSMLTLARGRRSSVGSDQG
jgi:hypothetical protein